MRVGIRRLVPAAATVGNRGPADTYANLGGKRAPRTGGCLPGQGIGVGAEQMLGGVWEWTSRRCGWPGSTPMVYEPQPRLFGGDYRVLRGSSRGRWSRHLRPTSAAGITISP